MTEKNREKIYGFQSGWWSWKASLGREHLRHGLKSSVTYIFGAPRIVYVHRKVYLKG